MKSLKLLNWSSTFRFEKPKGGSNQDEGAVNVYILGEKESKKRTDLIKAQALNWQMSGLLKNEKPVMSFSGSQGLVYILQEKKSVALKSSNQMFDESSYVHMRDSFGNIVQQLKAQQMKKVFFHLGAIKDSSFEAMIVGADMATYSYKTAMTAKPFEDFPEAKMTQLSVKQKKAFDLAQIKARAINRARHLVNMPPNLCNPETMEEMIRTTLPKNLKMEVWDAKRLEKENMHLHLSVGRGAEFEPRLIHLRYRPAKAGKKKPYAFVGKGITFDTGGLDLKPSSGMRMMKKDMGGSASIASLALFVAEAGLAQPCDFYLALAENAVDAKSFRPSDVYISRAGFKVEIDNTDAEGRLVLADALDVAVTQTGANEPEMVIDVATLTGACRVALGTDLAGLFTNDDQLGNQLVKTGSSVGDFCWQLPLVDRYFMAYNTPFADFKNSGESFGGAIAAALFLQKFVRGKKWAHLDAYCWTDKLTGAYSAAGGSGQTVQMLMSFLLGKS